ncbi:hypothetical protein [Actinomadura sp. HBU206391]|uniref:hypothetical protein n=1 Tax=Actinomadura sp. HBU206391 TaxID=2731692 RepID=UPI00164FAE42|nr:hypothetical protein [Actinomadura sp. HBU206391]MBC6456949.1 hypothetical protein [Actinomadura sp. HBU206391]
MTPAGRLAGGAMAAALLMGGATGCSDEPKAEPTSGTGTPVPNSSMSGSSLSIQSVNATINAVPAHVLTRTSIRSGDTRHEQQVELRLGKADGEAALVIDTDGVRSEARTSGERAWLKPGSASVRKLLPAGKSWVAMPAAQLRADGVPSRDDQLSMLFVIGGATSVRSIGTDTVEGRIRVRKYSFGVDVRRAVCAGPAEQRTTLLVLLGAAQGRTASARAEAWIDDFNLVRNLYLTVDLNGRQPVNYSLQVLGDAPVASARPPAGEVTSIDGSPRLRQALKGQPTPRSSITC